MSSQPLVVASQYGAGGSSTRVRLYDWLSHTGIEPVQRFEYRGASSNSPVALVRDPVGTWRGERAITRLVTSAPGHTVLLSRELSPLGTGRSEARLLTRAARGVYDFDDALYAALPGVPFGNLLSRRRTWARAVEAADVVIAGSDELAEHAAELSDRVVVIPSCVEHESYDVKTDFEIVDRPVAVWIGSPATEPYLHLIGDQLLRAHRELGLRLRVISAGSRSLGELDRMVDRTQWRPDTFADELSAADLGIMPLPDDEWTRGKCAYKLLQYAAAGLPLIGSAVGANIPVLERLGGVAAATDTEWYDGLVGLTRATASERAASGRWAREGVVADFCFSAGEGRWRDAVGLGTQPAASGSPA